MITVLMKISFQYWKKHKRRFFTLALSIIMGTAALCCSSLLIRSEKNAVLSQQLDYCGDYDVIIYETNAEITETISNLDGVEDLGFYYELGYASLPGGNQKYKTAAYRDEKSAELYHMSCIRGNYPVNENEIALDIETAKSLGIAPYPGEQIELALYDLEKQELCSRSFMISGIFVLSNKESYGGYYRYPGEGYVMPTVLMYAEMNQVFGSNLITTFVQVTEETAKEAIAALDIPQGSQWLTMDTFWRRTDAYSYVLGTWTTLVQDYGDYSLNSIFQAMKEGKVFKDFYSNILMPLFSCLILVIVMISVAELIRNVLKDRTEMIAILRSLGLSAAGSGIYLIIEFLLLTILLSLAGLAVGMGCHSLIIMLLNHIYNMRMTTGFHVSEYVATVTYNPYILPFVVIGVSVLGAVLIAVVRFSRVSPIMIFQGYLDRQSRKLHKKIDSAHPIRKGWMPLLNESIRLHDTSVIIMTIVVMSTAFFGYTYFSALADKENTGLKSELENNGLGNRDYLAKKSSDIYNFNFNTENHHDYGVSAEALLEFAENEFVESAYGMIVNISTRLSYSLEAVTETMESLLATVNLRNRSPSEDELENAMYEGQEAFMEAVGYYAEESVYAAPTVGISQELMLQLNDCLIAGELDWDRIQCGEEVVIAVPERFSSAAKEVFVIGDELPLSDIVLSEEEDLYDFGHILPADVAEPVYIKKVISDGIEIEYSEFAFGYRQDVQTKIGAVIAIPEDAEAAGYHDFIYELVYQDLQDYPVIILCGGSNAFQSWGLPDSLYTKVSASIKDGYNAEQADIAWYGFMSHASGMSTSSVSEVKMKMQNNTHKVMSLYYVIIIMLIVIGMTAIGISLYSRIRMSSTKIAYLRAIGMSLSQITMMILRQNIFYPFIGAVCAIIPVGLCQCFFYYIIWFTSSTDMVVVEYRLPWYSEIPYWYNLFSYHPAATLTVLTLVMMGLIFLVTIPQILYVKRQRIVEDLEKISF